MGDVCCTHWTVAAKLKGEKKKLQALMQENVRSFRMFQFFCQ
jgi:hypothetical protein